VVSPDRSLLGRLRGTTGAAGESASHFLSRASFADELISALETRALWGRYGF
jgi:hypothetical protein